MLGVGLLSACATPAGAPVVMTQTISVETDPPGAACRLSQNGVVVATLAATPGAVQTPKSPHPLVIDCEKPGFLTMRYTDRSQRQIDRPETFFAGLKALATKGDFFADGAHQPVARITLTPDPAMPASLRGVSPVAAIDTEGLTE